MSVEVEVKGFQSIEHVKVTLDGLTVLVGRSNLGKSALVRAVSALLTNPTGSDFVRHTPACHRATGGKTCKCFAQVTLRLSGHEITWQKGDSTHRYTVDGGLYDKVERGAPSFLQPLGLHPFAFGDDEAHLQVADQWQPLCLLDRKGSEVAEAVSGLGNLDRIHDALRRSESDKKQAASTRKVRESDLIASTQALTLFDGFDAALSLVSQAEQARRAYQTTQKKLEQVQAYLARQEVLQGVVDRTRELASLTLPVPPPPSLAQLRGYSGRYQSTLTAQDATARLTRALTVDPPAAPGALVLVRKLRRAGLDRPVPPSFTLEPPSSPRLLPAGWAAQVARLVKQARERKEALTRLESESTTLESTLATFALCQECGRPVP